MRVGTSLWKVFAWIVFGWALIFRRGDGILVKKKRAKGEAEAEAPEQHGKTWRRVSVRRPSEEGNNKSDSSR